MGTRDGTIAAREKTKGYSVKLRRGEIWLVDLEPSRRGELGKTRPCVIVSANAYNDSTSVPLVIPITGYPPTVKSPKLLATRQTGLSKDSSVLSLHVRAVAKSRFVHRLGRAPDAVVEAAAEILILIVG